MATANQYSQGEKVALGGAGLAAVGAFLPWIKLGQLGSMNGLDGDGTYTLIFAVVAVGIIVVRNWERIDKGAVAVLGLLTLGIGALYITDPAAGTNLGQAGAFGEAIAEALQPGMGLYVTALGGLGMLVGGGLGLQD
ncbi:hypothetical protein [Halobacterium wangiae]|uniref:hypothetical protein n=1 Tax=Halobacterium wangiae TaxID=2902623 RepID=UPI001E5675E2|nr:hypothetical protein [Halobacterium wangiae]